MLTKTTYKVQLCSVGFLPHRTFNQSGSPTVPYSGLTIGASEKSSNNFSEAPILLYIKDYCFATICFVSVSAEAISIPW